MSGNDKHRYGLFWPYLFSLENEETRRNTVKHIKQIRKSGYAYALPVKWMLEQSGIPFPDLYEQQNLNDACRNVALKFMLIDTDLAGEFLDEEQLNKARETYSRRQYKSKLLEELVSYFGALVNVFSRDDNGRFKNLFTISIWDEFDKLRSEAIDRSFGELKKVMEKLVSGIKSDCFMNAERSFEPMQYARLELNTELNEYVLQEFGYNFNKAHAFNVNWQSTSLLYETKNGDCNRILCTALLNNADFWSKHPEFNAVNFVNLIERYNGSTRAKKVLKHIFDTVKTIPNGELILKNGFSLYLSQYDRLLAALEEQAFRFTFNRLTQYCDLDKLKDIKICAPMSKGETAAIDIGKRLWEEFIYSYCYPDCGEDVARYIETEVQRFAEGETKSQDDIAVILDGAIFRFIAESEDRSIFTAYCPDCFTRENIMNRVYLRAYAVTLLSDEQNDRFAFLQRIFYDLINTLEKKRGFHTAHQMDTTARENSFKALKGKLNSYGIEVSDERKSEYIIALLDRDNALLEEAALFPVLEQSGDAIYGLAVAEMLFYDPKTENMRKRFEDRTRAESQIEVSVNCGFDRLYLNVGLPRKYEYDDPYYHYLCVKADGSDLSDSRHGVERYLADSLEMVIGAVCRDKGIEVALAFTKKLITETYPEEFTGEVRYADGPEHFPDLEADYWSKILPSPDMESVGFEHRYALKTALNKAVLSTIIGTDELSGRRYVSYSIGDNAIYGNDGYSGTDWVMYDYLHNGLSFVLNKYGDKVKAQYENYKKQYPKN